MSPRIKEQWYEIPYSASEYTFPRDAILRRVQFNDTTMHLELTDGRVISVPLSWIPSLQNAAPEEREKYEISQDRKMIVWDPDKCAINDEVRVADYLGIHPAIESVPASEKEKAVILDPDVYAYFRDSEAVNSALRSLIQLMSKIPPSDKLYVQKKVPARRVAERK